MSDTNVRKFLVGGAVRDQLMGRTPHDFDYSCEAPSFAAMKIWLEDEGYDLFLVKEEFNVIRAKRGKEIADFVLCRAEGPYLDHRHPSWTKPGTLADDQARRDLSINSIARAEDGTLIDPYNGQADIQSQIIRAVGDPKQRFSEDPLRVFRAFRFSITLGFTIEQHTKLAMQDAEILEFLRGPATSSERIREELVKAFKADTVGATLAMSQFPAMLSIAVDKGVWFRPTTEKI